MMNISKLQHVKYIEDKITIRKLTNFSLQFNFSILNDLKIRDDVLFLSLQEEFPFNECDQATIQKFLPLDAS